MPSFSHPLSFLSLSLHTQTHTHTRVHATDGYLPAFLTIKQSTFRSIFHGSITFVGTNGHFKWYTIELHVAQADCEGNIELEAHVREAVIVDISVSNPLDETIQFLVCFPC
jgi:hypothetical protein